MIGSKTRRAGAWLQRFNEPREPISRRFASQRHFTPQAPKLTRVRCILAATADVTKMRPSQHFMQDPFLVTVIMSFKTQEEAHVSEHAALRGQLNKRMDETSAQTARCLWVEVFAG